VLRLLIFLLVLVPRSTIAIQSLPAAEDACSLFEVMLANGMALTSGDVLVRERSFFDSVNGLWGVDEKGMVVDEETFSRLIFDFETGRFAVFLKYHRTRLDLAKQSTPNDSSTTGPEPEEFERFYGACVAGGESPVYSRLFPGARQVKKRTEYSSLESDFLGKIGFQDYRLFPLNEGANPSEIAAADAMIQRFRTGDSVGSFERVDNGQLEVMIKSPNMMQVPVPEGAKLKGAGVVWRFDPESQMPVSTKMVFRFKMADGQDVESSTGLGKEAGTRMEWQLMNDVYVIKSARNGSVQSLTGSSGRETKAEVIRRHDFHWFSVNEEVDPRFFDGSLLADRKGFLEIIDPKACGAESLIDREAKSPSQNGQTDRPPGKKKD